MTIFFTTNKLIVDQFRVWGTDNKGRKYPVFSCFGSDWNEVRTIYLEMYPDVVCIELQVAVPDKEYLAEQGRG